MLSEALMQSVHQLSDTLLERRLQLASAESCTAGGISYALTELAGSSTWFERGFVVYSNAAKTQMLEVPEAVIQRHGAVSERVAGHMAEGAVNMSHAMVGLSVTGVAGPGGGSVDKPVGTVCFGWYMRESVAHTEQMHFHGDRHDIRIQTIGHAITGAIAYIAKH